MTTRPFCPPVENAAPGEDNGLHEALESAAGCKSCRCPSWRYQGKPGLPQPEPTHKRKAVMQGFKQFLLRGNLIELAVAFIMGAAFNSVVESFTNIVLSVISKVVGGPPNFDDWVPGGLPVGAFLTQVIGFVLIAAVVYFALVLPVNKLREHMSTEKEAEPEVTETELLTEIRDLLATKN